MTPIDNLKRKYRTADEHLKAIEDAFMKQFAISEEQREQVCKGLREAFDVGHRTTATDDWCDAW